MSHLFTGRLANTCHNTCAAGLDHEASGVLGGGRWMNVTPAGSTRESNASRAAPSSRVPRRHPIHGRGDSRWLWI